jgi:hypothetical protein
VAVLAAAQSTTNTYITDVNGNKMVASSVVSKDGEHKEVTQSINGARVPLEKTDERVVSEDANGKVTERIVRKYDSNGQLASTERIVTEEQKRANGSSVKSTTYRSDVNGGMRETERKTVETETSGTVTKTQSVVERPTVNGGLQPVEKRSMVAETTPDKSHEEETVYRLNPNGEYSTALRNVSDTTHSGSQTITKSAEYEPIADASKMQLTRQAVTTTTTRPDGSSVSEVDLYKASVPGLVRETGSAPQLIEQQTIERGAVAGGVAETVTVRRPTANDPNRLGPPQKISETVCAGKCAPEPKK